MPVEIVDASGKLVQLKVRECSRGLIMTGSSRSQKKRVQRRDDRDKLIESYAAWELIKIAKVDRKSSNVRESFRFFQHKPSDIV